MEGPQTATYLENGKRRGGKVVRFTVLLIETRGTKSGLTV